MPNIFGDFPVYADGHAVGSVTVSQSGLMTVFDCACRSRSRDILRLAAVCGGRYVTLGIPAPEGGAAAPPPPASAAAPENGALRLKKSFSKKALDDLGFDNPRAFYLIRAEDISVPPPDPVDAVIPGTVDIAAPSPVPEAPPVQEAAAAEDASLMTEAYRLLDTDAEPENTVPEAAVLTDSEALPAASADDAAEETPVAEGWTQISTPGYIFSDPSVAEACNGLTGALLAVQEDYLQLAVPVSSQEPFPLMAVFCFGSSSLIGGREYIIFKVKDGNLIL